MILAQTTLLEYFFQSLDFALSGNYVGGSCDAQSSDRDNKPKLPAYLGVFEHGLHASGTDLVLKPT